MNIYCGNNALNSELLNGNLIIGNRYSCLKKGIGKGLYLPYDGNYNSDFQAIDQTKVYCGNQDNLPENYDVIGNNSQCLQKGIAIGKRKKALLGIKPVVIKYIIIFIIFAIIEVIIYFTLWSIKPSFLLQQLTYTNTPNIRDEKIIDNEKFILFFTIVSIIVFIILFYICKKKFVL
jgi:hypothetical protein